MYDNICVVYKLKNVPIRITSIGMINKYCLHYTYMHPADNDLLISLPLYFEEIRRLVSAFTGGSEELVLFIKTSGGLGPPPTPPLSPCIASSKDYVKRNCNLRTSLIP